MNHKSSRAHTIVRLHMQTRTRSDGNVANCMMSDLYVVDLAGRENERTTMVTGDRLNELSFINRSLMWLSQCIQDLGGTEASVPASPRLVHRDVQSTPSKPSAAFAGPSSNGKVAVVKRATTGGGAAKAKS